MQVRKTVLGNRYSKGEGVEQDFKEAVKWYRKAADQGYAYAQNNLGFRYYKGEGVPKSIVNSYVWWNIAAANGQQNAKNNKSTFTKEMTPAQIAKAEALAKEMVQKESEAN